MSKKLITSFVAFATILAVMVPVLPTQAVSIVTGDLVKASTTCKSFAADAVYEVSGSNLKVYPYLSVYLSWGYPSNFSTVKTVACSDLDSYTVEGYAKFRNGSAFRGTKQSVKGTYEARSVYYTENGKIRPISSCSVYNSLFGVTDCKSQTYWVPDAFVSTVSYDEGTMVSSTATLPEGLFVKLSTGKYGVVGSGNTVREFSSDAAITANRYDTSKAVNTTVALATGTSITGAESGLLTVGTQAITTTPTGTFTVALSANNPASSTLPQTSSNIELMKFNLANGSSSAITVSEMIFKRTGIGAVADWDNLYLYDETKILTITGRSISSDSHEATFAALSISIPANSTKEITLRGDVAAAAVAGDIHAFQLKSVVAGVTVNGLPVSSNAMTIGSVDLVGATIDATTTPSNPTVGQANAEVLNFSVANDGTNIQQFKQVVFTYNGTVSRSEVTNLKLYVYGESTVLASAANVESNDTVTLTLTTPYALTSGQNRTFSLKADLGGKKAQTIEFYVEETYHANVVDTFYGFPVAITNTCDSGDTTSLTLQGGTVTMADLGPVAGYIATNISDVILTKFSVTAARNVEVKQFDVVLIGSAGLSDVTPGTSGMIGDLRINDCDSGTTSGTNLMSKTISTTNCRAGSACDFGIAKDTNNTWRLTGAWNLVTGVKKNLCVTVDIGTSAHLTDYIADSSTAETLRADIWPVDAGNSDFYFRDVSTGDYILQVDVVPASITGDNQSITAATLATTAASTPVSHTAVIGTTNDSALGVVLKAGDGSDISIKQIAVRVHVNSAATFLAANEDTTPAGEVVKISLYDGTTLLEKTGVNTSATHDYALATFSNLNLTVLKSKTLTLTVKLDYSSSIAGTTYVAASVYGANITAYNKDGNTVTVTSNVNAVDGTNYPGGTTLLNAKIVTVTTAGSITMAQDASTPDSGIVLAGTSDVVISKIKFIATNENWTINELRVKLNTPGNEGSVALVKIAYPGGTTTGSLSTTSNESYFDFTGLNWLVEKNTYETLTISANLKAISTDVNETGREIKLGVDFNGGFKAVGDSMTVDTSLDNGADVFGELMYLRMTKPIVTVAAISNSGAGKLSNGPLEFSRVAVAADSNGPVTVKKLSWTVNITDAAAGDLDVATWKLYDGSTSLAGTWSNGTTTSTDGSLPSLAAGTSYLVFELTTEKEIGAGSSKTFVLKATVSDAQTAGDSVTVGLYSASDTTLLTGGLYDHATQLVQLNDGTTQTKADFIWSDMAEGIGHTYSYQSTYVDWSNSYLLNLPSDTCFYSWPS